jgi:homoserine/homoserine lactone efflux protein
LSIEIWVSFIFASLILCFSSGPTIFLVIVQSLNHGKKSVVPLVTGVLSGDLVAMSLSFAGLGFLLSTSVMLFNIFKLIAATYLFYLGIKAWRTKSNEVKVKNISINKGKVFKEAMLVTAFNPKGIIFYSAFFPLFIDAKKEIIPQLTIIAISFLLVAVASTYFYSAFSGYLGSKVKSAMFQSTFNKANGTMLMGAGVVTASMQK